jgi:hypothetical protein
MAGAGLLELGSGVGETVGEPTLAGELDLVAVLLRVAVIVAVRLGVALAVGFCVPTGVPMLLADAEALAITLEADGRGVCVGDRDAVTVGDPDDTYVSVGAGVMVPACVVLAVAVTLGVPALVAVPTLVATAVADGVTVGHEVDPRGAPGHGPTHVAVVWAPISP